MKKIFVLVVVALMSTVMLNAKTVRGYVSDVDGKPVVGVRMVVKNVDCPGCGSVAMTDQEGHFILDVPDEIDTADLVKVFAQRGAQVMDYKNTASGLRIVVAKPQPKEAR